MNVYTGMKFAKKPTSQVQPSRGTPVCPASITGEARAEWDRVCAELNELGTLTSSDRAILLLYVKAWERWTAAEAKITPDTLLVASPKTKVPMHNPFMAISNKAHEQCVKLAGELGLTPRARAIMAKNAAMGNRGTDTDTADDDFSELDAAA
jgi:P27 family predicted phage terminase small subunit